jgi:uroporphyrinogen decarboxylase
MGGLDRHGVIALGGAAEIKRAVIQALNNASRPFILGAECTLPSGIQWDQIRAAIAACHAYPA